MLGIYPDPTKAIVNGRMRLCEAIAVHCAAAIQDTVNMDDLAAVTESLVGQNPEALSAGVRTADGNLLTYAGNHERYWQESDSDKSTPTHIRIPIIQNDERWGTIEIAFTPVNGEGFWAWVQHPVIGMMSFVGVFSFIAYMYYLRRTLKFLNPQSVIPERIQALLNTLTEGVAVLDAKEQIVLANDAFAKLVGSESSKLQGTKLSKLGWERLEEDDTDDEFPWVAAARDSYTKIGVALTFDTDKEGTRTLMVNAAPVIGGDGNARGALATFDDVTAIQMKNVQLNDVVSMLKHQYGIAVAWRRLITTVAMAICPNSESAGSKNFIVWY